MFTTTQCLRRCLPAIIEGKSRTIKIIKWISNILLGLIPILKFGVSKVPTIKPLENWNDYMIHFIQNLSYAWTLLPIAVYIIIILARKVCQLEDEKISKIKAVFDENDLGCKKIATDKTEGKPDDKQMFYKLKVYSEAGTLLKACKGSIDDIQYKGVDGSFSSIYYQSLFLSWAHHNVEGDGRKMNIEGIGKFNYLDIFNTSQNDKNIRLSIWDRDLREVDYSSFFKEFGVYRLTIWISSKFCPPVKVILEINWQGIWDGLTVTLVS